MRIANDRPLKELRQEFSERFPFLEIAFFRQDELQPVSEQLDLRVADLRTFGNDGKLMLDGNLPPRAIEQTMADVFGLRTKVRCRKASSAAMFKCPPSLDGQNHWAMHLAEDVVIV